MSGSTCPNCRQPVAPTDDICENCGAVLSSLGAQPVRVTASFATTRGMPAMPHSPCPRSEVLQFLRLSLCDGYDSGCFASDQPAASCFSNGAAWRW